MKTQRLVTDEFNCPKAGIQDVPYAEPGPVTITLREIRLTTPRTDQTTRVIQGCTGAVQCGMLRKTETSLSLVGKWDNCEYEKSRKHG